MKILKPKGFILLLALALGLKAEAQEVFSNNELAITKIEQNVWVLETNDNTTMYIVEGSQKAVLIDTGTKTAKLDSIVKLVTQKPLEVLITHVHPDHAGNMHYFQKPWIHPADTVLLGMFGMDYQGETKFLKDGQKFDLGGTVLEVVHTPGHTPGSIVLIDRATGNCFSGDSFGSGQVWMQLEPHVSMKIYAASCQKMEKLMNGVIAKVFCGHYPYAKKAFDKTYISNMRQLAEQLSKGVALDAEDYPMHIGVGASKPKMVSLGEASIVYDSENIN